MTTEEKTNGKRYLTTKEFIKEVKKLGFIVEEDTGAIEIYLNNERIAYVYRYEIFSANTAYIPFDVLSKKFVEKLYNLIDAYARTPLEEREEPQKYYLKLIGSKNNRWNYLNYNTINDFLELDSEKYKSYAEIQFTDKELDKLREKFGITFNDFEKIPVEEDKEKEECWQQKNL